MTPIRRQSDQDLAALSGTGDERAFTLLFERHGPALYRYCRSIVHHEQDAQDVVQTTMIQALTALRDRPLEAPLKPWLFRIAHNESITLLRRRRPTADLDAQHDVAGISIDGQVDDRERLSTLVTDLGALPERQRSALIMRELSGLSHEEIAGALTVTVAQAKQAIFEARRGLDEAAVGRDMTCEPVQRAISDGDGRVLRARHMRSHVRSCRDCRAMRDGIASRERDLASLFPPLTAASAGTLLERIVEASGTHTDAVAGGATAAAGAGAAAAGALSGKTLAIVAALVMATGAASFVAGRTDRTAERPGTVVDRDGSGPAAGHVSTTLVAGAPLLGGAGAGVGGIPVGHGPTTTSGGASAGVLPTALPPGVIPPGSDALPATAAAGSANQTAGGLSTAAGQVVQPTISRARQSGQGVVNNAANVTHTVVHATTNATHAASGAAAPVVQQVTDAASQAAATADQAAGAASQAAGAASSASTTLLTGHAATP